MNSRFTTVAGFLTAATLLSGSAFGFAPEFSQDLPTVIITDKLPGADSATPYDVNGVGSATTENVFRFSKAFDMEDYFTPESLQGNTFSQLKYLFSEHDDLDDASPNSALTLMINGDQAVTAVPDASTVDTSGALFTERYADGGLDFRNTALSGTNEAVNSGFADFDGSQERIVTLYVKGETSDELAVKSFKVITTDEGEDSLSDPIGLVSGAGTVIYESEVFDGWETGALALLAGIPFNAATYDLYTDNDTSGFTSTPATGPAPAGTQSVTMTAAAGQVGYITWALNPVPGVSLTANNLYRLRANMYSSSATTKDTARISIGNQYSSGLATVAYNDSRQAAAGTSPALLPTDVNNNVDVWLMAEAAASSISINAEIVGDALGLGTGQNVTIDELSITEYDGLSDLGSATVIFNHGAVPAGEVDAAIDPVASPDAFVVSGTAVAGTTWEAGKLNQQASATNALSGTQLKVTNNASNGVAPPSYTAIALAGGSTTDPTVAGAFQVAADKLYQLDIWASTDTAKTAEKSFPDLQISVSQQATQAAFLLHELSQVAGAVTVGAPIATTPRAYTLLWQPQTGEALSEASLTITLLSTDKTYTTASSVIIHQVTLREYTAPE